MRRLTQMAVIAVVAGVEDADGDIGSLQLLELRRKPTRKVIAFCDNADKDDVGRAAIALDDLVRYARETAADLIGVHNGRLEAHFVDLRGEYPPLGRRPGGPGSLRTARRAHASTMSSNAIRTCSPLRACLK